MSFKYTKSPQEQALDIHLNLLIQNARMSMHPHLVVFPVGGGAFRIDSKNPGILRGMRFDKIIIDEIV